ncbi:MAG: TPM domain-containing protein [bacterium]
MRLRPLPIILLLLTAAAAAPAQAAYPPASGYINDYAGVISASTDLKLERLLTALDRETTAQIAVAIVEDTDGEDMESYATGLYEKWGLGVKGADNGALLLVVTGQKKMRIEVGYGLEGRIPDAKAGAIIDGVISPRFKKGDFDGGITDGVLALAGEAAAEYGLTLEDLGQTEYPTGYRTVKAPAMPLAQKIFGLLFLIAMAILFIKNPSLFFMLLLFGGMGRGGGMTRGGWSSGDFGGFGGGFGGFGGGMSGGGGASGGW